MSTVTKPADCQRWGMVELAVTLDVSDLLNPFEHTFTARFSYQHRTISIDSFYDGDGIYRVRFMPDTEGVWDYDFAGASGQFTCTPPETGNHGPVRVIDGQFRYADNTPHVSVGTTCYAWTHQTEELEQTTLDTLKKAPFNKMRMCVFPKHYVFNQNEPRWDAFEKDETGNWDCTRPNPAYFQHFEKRIAQLCEMGIEADLILFHPYDRWGYKAMGQANDEAYLSYLVRRVAAYRNVWWSFANEYDLMRDRTSEHWDRYAAVVRENDAFDHLRSIHNCRGFYDHGKPWVTHCSVQHDETYRTGEWRNMYGKPVIVDECCYEGDIPNRWGNISGQQLTHRFWDALCRGGFAGHGETYLDEQDVLWWAKGGTLKGESPARIGFMRKIAETLPELKKIEGLSADMPAVGKQDEAWLMYFGVQRPRWKEIPFPEDCQWDVWLLYTWAMTQKYIGKFSGRMRVDLTAQEYMGLLVRRVV